MTGRLFAVVGPSGVGKDPLLAGAVACDPSLHWVRRGITRPESAVRSVKPVKPFGPVRVKVTAEFEALTRSNCTCWPATAEKFHWSML